MIRYILITNLALAACSTPKGSIQSNRPSNAVVLDNDFEVVAQLGQMPIELQSSSDIERYGIEAQGRPAEYLFIVNPQKVEGPISIDLAEVPNWVESVVGHRDYIDDLLYAHREFLKGRIDNAKKILISLTEKYNQSFGTAILLANIAFLNGDYKEAASLYQTAASLNPEGVGSAFSGLPKTGEGQNQN